MHRGLVLAALLAFATPVAGAVAYVATDAEPAMRAAAAPRPVAPPGAPPVSYAGTTSQQLKIGFDLSADGRTIEGLYVTYRAECGGPGGLAFELDDVFYTPVAVAPDGRFAVEDVGMRLAFQGRVAGGRASGTVQVDYEYGGMFQCRTPALRWAAVS